MSVAESAKSFYETDLKERLEAEHMGEYVAIEPVSRSFFIGETFIEAAMAAKSAEPTRKSFVLRVGHEAAIHMGSTLV